MATNFLVKMGEIGRLINGLQYHTSDFKKNHLGWSGHIV